MSMAQNHTPVCKQWGALVDMSLSLGSAFLEKFITSTVHFKSKNGGADKKGPCWTV